MSASSLPEGRARTATKWAKLLGILLGGQAAVQAVSMILGFLMLRWLTKDEYAKYGLANAFQGSLSILAEFGFASSVVSLVGANHEDPNITGRIIAAAKILRSRSVLVAIPTSLAVFMFLTRSQPWTLTSKLLLWSGIASGVFFNAWAVYRSPLLMHKQIKKVNTIELSSAFIRVGLTALLSQCHFLLGWSASWVGSLGSAITGFFFRRNSSQYVDHGAECTRETLDQTVKFVAPLWPELVYTSFQSQIGIMLIAYFGTESSIAAVAALGRLSQVLAVISTANLAIIQPVIAQSGTDTLRRKIVVILSLSFLAALAFYLAGAFIPSFWILLLGKKYASLSVYFPWAFAGPCVFYLFSVVYMIVITRKWVSWKFSLYQMGFLLVSQVLYLCFYVPRTTLAALQLSLFSSTTALFAGLCILIVGLARSTKVEEPPSGTPNSAL